jgi:HTH-type transcriptional regulator/antitoxin HigA
MIAKKGPPASRQPFRRPRALRRDAAGRRDRLRRRHGESDTLRYDRLDNFWFSLLHELAHVGRHFDGTVEAFVDDFSLREMPSRHEDVRESEADDWANDALIPKSEWSTSGLSSHPGYTGIIAFSQRLGIHPAVVAGRIRHQTRNFRAFVPLLGTGEVRKQLEIEE